MFDTELVMRNTEKDIGYQLRLTNNAVKNFVDDECQKKLTKHLTGIQGLTLGYIYNHKGEQVTSQDVMKAFDLKKAAVSEALCNLVSKGLVSMNVSKDDRRKKYLSLTETGEKAHLDFMVVRDSTREVIENGLDDQEREVFKTICEKVRKNVGGKND